MKSLCIIVSVPNPASRLLEISYEINFESSQNRVVMQLPLWRPGRYENQNYAKNIIDFSVLNAENQALLFTKTSPNAWIINSDSSQKINIKYNYYAHQQDAGGSYVDDDFWYINFVNCCMQLQGFEGDISLVLNVPKSYKISCGLPFEQKETSINTVCKSWYELYDSPLMASPNLQVLQYTVNEIPFYLWFYGVSELPFAEKMLSDFTKFTQYQFDLFGSFPFTDYHFQFLILPFKYYHGVEHRNSTVIVLGDAHDFAQGRLYDDFLGISSHELFHAWNICKIRPKELMPYNYHQQNLFNTGFVAEGFTTYLGDYILYKSGVITKIQYEVELDNVLKKHFYNMANTFISLADSSFDLWVDGYQPSHAQRKVSIYDKGATVAFVLDAFIEKLSNQEYSLVHVLQNLWKNYGHTAIGYTENDVYNLIEKYAGKEIKLIYEECIFGKTDLRDFVEEALQLKGFNVDIKSIFNHDIFTKGYSVILKNKQTLVDKINPNHPVSKQISLGDELLENGTIKRNGRVINLSV